MVNLGKHWAWVEVEGRPLAEYQPFISPDGREAVTWIPSEAGKNFHICVRDADFSYSWATKVVIDGTTVQGGKVVRSRTKATVHHKGASITNHQYKPFVFSMCKLVEDDDPSVILNTSSTIGEIKVIINEVQVLHHSTLDIPTAELPPLTVSERAKKGLVHGTQLGDVLEKRNKKKPWKSRKIRRIATFIFRYRPLSVLQANGIVTSSAPTVTNSQRRPSTNIGFVDLTAKDEPSSSKKRHFSEDESAAPRKVKKERSTTHFDEIIDLT